MSTDKTGSASPGRKETKRKQIVLRLPESLWNEIAGWAEDDFRSINGQIEYLLTRSVRERRKNKASAE